MAATCKTPSTTAREMARPVAEDAENAQEGTNEEGAPREATERYFSHARARDMNYAFDMPSFGAESRAAAVSKA